MKLRTRILILFLACILVSTALSVSLTAWFGREHYLDQASQNCTQTLQAVADTVKTMTEYVDQNTYAVIWNPMVQDAIAGLADGPMTPEIRSAVTDSLMPVMLAGDDISSILFYDNYGNSGFCLRSGVLFNNGVPVDRTSWYSDVMAADGDWIYETAGGGLVSYADGKRNSLSMIKVIKSREDYAVLGLLMVNIDESSIRQRIESVGGTRSGFCILSDGEPIFESENGVDYDNCRDAFAALSPGDTQLVNDDGGSLLYAKLDLGISNWEIVSETPVDAGYSMDLRQTAMILLGNVALLLLCWCFITRYMSLPLREMERHLAAADGIPEDFPVKPGARDEISNLKTAYNGMLASVRALMQKTREEETAIRRNELELMLEQVSPHFLYNTLDTISGMILSGDTGNSFRLVQALGLFYRNSFNGGQQIVTLRQELDTVKNYLIILNTRYGGKLDVQFSVDESLYDARILKLILQPLAENAVHHGIRPKGGTGTIKISAARQPGGTLLLSVWDNGIGMSSEKADALLHSREKSGNGFGIFSVRQRLELFYGISNPLRIESREGEWTRISIRIPENWSGE